MWLPSIFRILQTICLFGTTYCRISLIRPGAISEEIIVPSLPSGSSTNVIVLVTFFTLQSTRSPSSMIVITRLLRHVIGFLLFRQLGLLVRRCKLGI